MANKILVLGESGTGKTFSLRNMDRKSMFYINADMKSLPFRGWKSNFFTVRDESNKVDLHKSNYFKTNKPEHIEKILRFVSAHRPDIKVVIVDTITLMMTDMFMARITEKGFDKYSEQAGSTYALVKGVDNLRDDLNVVFMAHTETEDYETKFFVPGGKLLKEKVKMESNFTTVIMTHVENSESGSNNYYFLTENNGSNTVKSPFGMFPGKMVENDLAKVIEYVDAYEDDRQVDPAMAFETVIGEAIESEAPQQTNAEKKEEMTEL